MNLAETPQLALPSFVQIEPVGQCSMECKTIPVSYYRRDAPRGRPPAFIRFDAFCRLIDELPAIQELQLQSAAEPLSHPRFFDMVRYAAARGIEVSTHTRLTTLSARRAEECVASGLRRMHVVLGRPGAERTRVLANLRRLIGAKRSAGSRWPHIHFAHAGQAGRLAVRGPCEWPRRGAHISFSGEATPCRRAAAAGRKSFGNMMKDGAVRIWNNEAYQDFRERLAGGEPPEICRGCDVYRQTG
jgi:MoaA/NifB/PqqE/SkfB family radical SAM enzyme